MAEAAPAPNLVTCPFCDGPTEQGEIDRPDGYRLLDEYKCRRCRLSGPAETLGLLRVRLTELERGVRTAMELSALPAVVKIAPVPMLLFCPACGAQHVDEGEWATTRAHRSHECQALGCGHVWRPADVATVGVAKLTTQGTADGSPVPQLGQAERVLRDEGITKVCFDALGVALFDRLRGGRDPVAKGRTLERAVAKLRKERADG
jgi:hypothetical protein